MEVHAYNKMLGSSKSLTLADLIPQRRTSAPPDLWKEHRTNNLSEHILLILNLNVSALLPSAFTIWNTCFCHTQHFSQACLHLPSYYVDYSISQTLFWKFCFNQACSTVIKVWAWEPLDSVLHVNSSSEPILLTQVGPGPYMDMWASVFPAHFTGWIVCNIASAAPMFSGFGTVGVAGMGVWSTVQSLCRGHYWLTW